MQIKEIQTETELNAVLDLCYSVLGENSPVLETSDLYRRDAWRERLADGHQPLVYAVEDGKIVSAVLGRAEHADSMVIGFTACHAAYRRRGITKQLMQHFEDRARGMGYKYITLGSFEDAFYERCGYHVIAQAGGQNIYQKLL